MSSVLTQTIYVITRGGLGRHPALNSMDNTHTKLAQILVDQAILVHIQNENEILHKLVIEVQASNAQLQS